ncbi:WAT1-related protein At1g09380-like [Ipomoea triloba]|uniref:WAT1-related protein At1g09380-like n=1 Tax=Ipomoea triloba TaxID=35885 RepID=UPI00125D8DAD|nr:WAT1-related protein At1g09380-like [Ipomoea triloba]
MGADLLALMMMIFVQFGYAVMNIISKVAMDSGMNPFVHVAYRQLFASIAIAPIAYFYERRIRPQMTLSILFNIFLCSIFGISLNQITYFVGLKNSTPTIACALTNLIPAVTYLMAVPFGIEKLMIRSAAGKAKVVGTILCVGGAMLLSFYHGHNIGIGESSIHWKYADHLSSQNKINNNNGSTNTQPNFILGPFLIIVSAVSWAIWSIIQTRVSEKYPAPYSSTALMCLMSSIQCVVFAVCFDHKPSDWSLRQGIRATSTVYAGIMGTAIAYCLMSWCIDKKGPLYVSVFNPLLLVIVAVLSWGLLRDKIYVGTIVGSVLIVVGLYGVLWGKQQELRQVIGVVDVDEEEAIDEVKTKEDNLEELELSGHSIITVDQFPKK